MRKFINTITGYHWGIFLFAILLTAVGLCFLVFPEETMSKTVIAVALFTILYAVCMAVVTLLDSKRDISFFFRMLGAVLSLFCAIYLLIHHDDRAGEILTLYVGVLLMVDGSFKLHTAVLSKRYKMFLWWLIIFFSLFVLATGVILLRFTPEKAQSCAVLMGLSLIADGMQNFVATFYGPVLEKRMREHSCDGRDAGEQELTSDVEAKEETVEK